MAITSNGTANSSSDIVRVGVGVLIMRNNKVLIGKRIGSHGAGTWQLAGGHLDYGESFEECAVREGLEETGLNLDITTARMVATTNNIMSSENKHYVTIFVSVNCVDNNQEPKVMEPNKCEQWRWVTLDDLRNEQGPYRPLFSPLDKLTATHDLRPVFATSAIRED